MMSSPTGIPDDYELRLVESEDDRAKLTALVGAEMFPSNPAAVALGALAENSGRLLEWRIATCLHYPHTRIALKKATGDAVGFSLIAMRHRKAAEDFKPFDPEVTDKNVQMLSDIPAQLMAEFWKQQPASVSKVLLCYEPRAPNEQLYKEMRRYGHLDREQLKADGIAGFVTQAVSAEIQQRNARDGLQLIGEVDLEQLAKKWSHEEPLNFVNPARSVQLFFAPF